MTMNKQLLAFEVMYAVKREYAESKKRDSEFAKILSARLGEHVNLARVRQARLALNIPSNGPANPEVEEAKRLIKLLLNSFEHDRSDESYALAKAAYDFIGEAMP